MLQRCSGVVSKRLSRWEEIPKSKSGSNLSQTTAGPKLPVDASWLNDDGPIPGSCFKQTDIFRGKSVLLVDVSNQSHEHQSEIDLILN